MYLNLAECDSQKDNSYANPIPEVLLCSKSKPPEVNLTGSSEIALLPGKCMWLV